LFSLAEESPVDSHTPLMGLPFRSKSNVIANNDVLVLHRSV